MDKNTLSQYGWVVIVIIVLIILIALATPFGSFVAKSVKSSVEAFDGKVDSMFDGANINYSSPEFKESAGTKTEPIITHYTTEQIAANDRLFAIGATQPEYVVAEFNSDYTVLTVTKNGDNSDGLILDFSEEFSRAEASVSESVLTETMYAIPAQLASGTPYDVPRAQYFLLDGFSNHIQAIAMPILEEGQSLGYYDQNMNPLTDDAEAWAYNRLYEVTDGAVTCEPGSGNFVYAPGGDTKLANFVLNGSNNAYAYYSEANRNNGELFFFSLYSMYKVYETIGAIPTPAWLAQTTLKTVNICDDVTVQDGFINSMGYDDQPITINIAPSASYSTNAFPRSIINID